MRYTFKDVLESMPEERYKEDPKILRVYRLLSYVPAWICSNLGVSANAVSVFSVMVALAGSLLMIFDNNIMRISGVVILNLWMVCDCIDGEVARTTQTNSYMGEYFDAIGGYAIFAFSPLGISVAAYHTTSCIREYRYLFIILGAVSSVSGLYARLAHQKYIHSVNNTYIRTGDKIISTDSSQSYVNPKKDFSYYRNKIDMLMGTCGIYFPLLITSCITDRYDFFTIFYACYFALGSMFILIVYFRKASVFNKEIVQKYGKSI